MSSSCAASSGSTPRCDNCKRSPATLVCGGCNEVFYCHISCARASWPDHKAVCVPPPSGLTDDLPDEHEAIEVPPANREARGLPDFNAHGPTIAIVTAISQVHALTTPLWQHCAVCGFEDRADAGLDAGCFCMTFLVKNALMTRMTTRPNSDKAAAMFLGWLFIPAFRCFSADGFGGLGDERVPLRAVTAALRRHLFIPDEVGKQSRTKGLEWYEMQRQRQAASTAAAPAAGAATGGGGTAATPAAGTAYCPDALSAPQYCITAMDSTFELRCRACNKVHGERTLQFLELPGAAGDAMAARLRQFAARLCAGDDWACCGASDRHCVLVTPARVLIAVPAEGAGDLDAAAEVDLTPLMAAGGSCAAYNVDAVVAYDDSEEAVEEAAAAAGAASAGAVARPAPGGRWVVHAFSHGPLHMGGAAAGKLYSKLAVADIFGTAAGTGAAGGVGGGAAAAAGGGAAGGADAVAPPPRLLPVAEDVCLLVASGKRLTAEPFCEPERRSAVLAAKRVRIVFGTLQPDGGDVA